jgi:hypothetical protein
MTTPAEEATFIALWTQGLTTAGAADRPPQRPAREETQR